MLERRVGADGDTRLVMLEPVREYAAERLSASPDASETEQRHARYYLALAEQAYTELIGVDQVAWGHRVDADAANLRRALDYGITSDDGALVVRLAGALEEWWFDRGLWHEGGRWLVWALARCDDSTPPAYRARGWLALAYMLWVDEDFASILEAVDHAAALYATVNDQRGMAWCEIMRSFTHHSALEPAAAEAAVDKAIQLARHTDDATRGSALRAQAALMHDDPPQALDVADQAAVMLERAGDLRSLARLWDEIGYLALEAGAFDDARELVERALALYERLEQPADRATTLASYAIVMLESGDEEQARWRLHEALERLNALGIRPYVAELLLGLAVITARQGDAEAAGRLVGAATVMRSATEQSPLEARLEATAREAATDCCSQGSWDAAVADGLALGPEASIAVGLDAANAQANPAAAR